MNRKLEKLHPEQWESELKKWEYDISMLLRNMKIEKNQNPESKGHIRISKSHGCTQFYYTEGKKRKYIAKNELDLIKEIVQKDFNNHYIMSLENEKKLVSKFLDKYDKTKASNLEKKLNPDRRELLELPTLSNKEYAEKWMKETYRKKDFSEKDPDFRTSKNERVRSKSELIIANMLEKNNVPYKYEYPVKLENHYVHPDFLCLNIRTRKEYIWEHLGLLDNPDYAAKNVKKINDYQRSGFFLGQELLISMETKNHPLSTLDAERMIFRYLI